MNIEQPIRITTSCEDGEFTPRVIRAAILKRIHVHIPVPANERERVRRAESVIHRRCGEATQAIMCAMGVFVEYNIVARSNADNFHVITRESGGTVMASDHRLSGSLAWAIDAWRRGNHPDVLWAAFGEGCKHDAAVIQDGLDDWS